MATKSISEQIIDEFIEELSQNSSMPKYSLDSLKKLLIAGKLKKEDIVKLLREEEKHENS